MKYFFFQVFEEEKVHELMTISDYPLYVVPLDEDILSFELDLAYKVLWTLFYNGFYSLT